MPVWFRVVAELNPLTWSVDILRAIAFGASTGVRIPIEMAAYVAATAAAFAWALSSLRTALK
jgi:ABC-type multidrug transport system permease subunit